MKSSLEKSSMNYREAMDFVYEYGIIQPGDIIDKKYFEAQRIINEYRVKEFLKYKKE